MTRSLAPIVAACLAALPAPALAQEQSETDDIVVTGRAEQPPAREVSRQAREITQGGDFLHAPLARFEDRLCPGIIGLKPEFASLMIDRIRYNAQQLDMWMGDDTGCSPNFIVAFVPDGKAELAQLQEKHHYLFTPMATADRKELMAEDGPVRVWTTTQMRSRDGMPIARRESLTDPPTVSMWSAHSKIYVPVREDITSVVVLFDLDDVKGKSLVQLADYATMRGLARTRPVDGEGRAMDTILSLFDTSASPPLELTAFDRAYLGSLYSSIANLPGAVKIGGINRHLRLQAAAEEAGK